MRSLGAEGSDCPAFLEPHIRVELGGQNRLEIVARKLALRAVNHPDRALEQRLPESVLQLCSCAATPIGKAARHAGAAERAFPTVVARRADLHHSHLGAPVRRGGNRASVRAEADQHRLLAIALTPQLADLELALPAHRRS